MCHRIRVRRLSRSHLAQNLVRRFCVGLHPHVDQPKFGVIISLSAEHKIPTSFDASLLDLESRQIVAEKRVGFDHAEPPVGLVPPVVIFLQLNSDSRHRSCGWSQSSRINPTDVKTWRFNVGDVGNLGLPRSSGRRSPGDQGAETPKRPGYAGDGAPAGEWQRRELPSGARRRRRWRRSGDE